MNSNNIVCSIFLCLSEFISTNDNICIFNLSVNYLWQYLCVSWKFYTFAIKFLTERLNEVLCSSSEKAAEEEEDKNCAIHGCF